MKNFKSECTEFDLYDQFIQFGKIKSIMIKRGEDGNSLGYGWVNFEQACDAKKALDFYSGSSLYVRENI